MMPSPSLLVSRPDHFWSPQQATSLRSPTHSRKELKPTSRIRDLRARLHHSSTAEFNEKTLSFLNRHNG